MMQQRGDGAQRLQVVVDAVVVDAMEQEMHKKEVPGGSGGGPGEVMNEE